MKFGIELERTLFPLWKSYYVDYEGLKDLLYELKQHFPYFTLFEKHKVFINYDEDEPFKFLVSAVSFTFRDLDSDSPRTRSEGFFKVISIREKQEDYEQRLKDRRAIIDAIVREIYGLDDHGDEEYDDLADFGRSRNKGGEDGSHKDGDDDEFVLVPSSSRYLLDGDNDDNDSYDDNERTVKNQQGQLHKQNADDEQDEEPSNRGDAKSSVTFTIGEKKVEGEEKDKHENNRVAREATEEEGVSVVGKEDGEERMTNDPSSSTAVDANNSLSSPSTLKSALKKKEREVEFSTEGDVHQSTCTTCVTTATSGTDLRRRKIGGSSATRKEERAAMKKNDKNTNISKTNRKQTVGEGDDDDEDDESRAALGGERGSGRAFVFDLCRANGGDKHPLKAEEGSNTKNNQHLLDDRSDSNDDDDDDETETDDSASMSRYGVDPTVKRSPAVKAALKSFVYLAKAVVADLSIGGNGQCESLVRHYHENINTARMVQQARMVPVQHDGTAAGGKETSEFAPYEATAVHRGDTSSTMPPIVISAQEAYEAATALLLHDETFAAAFAAASAGALLTAPSSYSNPVVVTDEERDERHNNAMVVSDKEERSAVANNRSTARTEMSNSHFSSSHFTKNGVTTRLPPKFARRGLLLRALPVLQRLRSEFCDVVPPTANHVELFHIDPSTAMMLRRCGRTISYYDKKNAKLSQGARRQGSGKKSSSSSSSSCCSCWPFSGWRSRSTPRARRRRGNNSFAASSGGDQKADQEQQPFFSGGVQMIKDNWDVVTSMLGEDSGEEDDSDNDVTFHSFGSPMRVAQQVNGPILTAAAAAAAAAAKTTTAPPHPASVGPATAGKRDGDYTQDFSSSSSAVVSMRTFTSADNDNRNYNSGADVGTRGDSKGGSVVPPLALGGSGSANASVLSSRTLAGLAPGVLGLFVRGGGGEYGCIEGEAVGSVLNIPLAYDEETAAEHYKSNVVENVLEPDSVGYAGPPTPRLGNSSFSRSHQGGGEGSSFNSVANAFSNQGDHGNNNADSSTQNNFSSIAAANHDDDNKGATSSLSTQNGSFPPTSQHQQQHSSSETRRSVLAGLRLSIRNIRGSGNKEGNTQNNLHQLHMSSPNFVSNDDETRGSGAGGGRPSPSAGPKTSTSPSFAASLQRFTSAGGGYTRASVANGGGGGAPVDNGSGSLNNNNGSIGGADVSLARRYASTLPFASSLFPTVCPRLHKLHMTHKLGDIRLTMHIYVKSATIAAAPLAPHHQAKMENSAARSGGYPRTAASADEGGEGTVRKRAVSFYETSTNALKAIGSVGEYLSFVGNEGPTGDQSAPSQQQRKKSAQQQQFQTTRVKDKVQAEDPSVQQKWLVLSEVGYCNPAIAHALYAYQRSVARALAAAVQQEIEKVSSFYLSQSHILCRAALLSIDSVKMWHTLNTRERAQLHTVYRQTYLTFRILHQYCDLNILALGKFLKKADKNLFQNSLKNYQDHLDSLNFRMGHSSRIMALQELMVERLAEHAMGGSNKKAYNFLQTTRDEDSDFLIASGPGQKGGGGGGGSGSGGATRLGKNKRTTYTSMAFLGGLLLSLMCMITLLMSEGGTRSGHLTIFDGDAFSKKNAEYLILVPLILAIPQFFFSINVMIYEAYGINFAFMFELDPIFHFTGAELMRDSLIYFVGWAACVYIFLRNSVMLLSCGDCKNSTSREDVFTPSVAPLWAIMPLFVFIWLGIAFKNRYYSSERRPFWSAEVFWRILTTPYYPVRFPDFFVLNYLTSLTTVIYELQFYWCTFSTSPAAECSIGRSMSLCILNSLPNTWRMLQCVKRFIVQPKAGRKPFPNLVNGGKYLTGVIQPIVWTMWAVAKYQKRDDSVITTLYVLSFASQLIMQTYKYLWDVVVDAGTFIDYGNGYEWRRERVYKAWWPYILFMVVDFVLRWRWLATYYIQLSYKPAWFFFMWSIVELIRRSFWSAFRVENEHVNNTEHYRATKLAPIPVKTIHAWDTFASDASPEQFLSKKKRDEFSKEFPSIKGVNLSSVTRYFAGLPEEEKLKILLNSPLCTSFVPPPPSHGNNFSAADSSSVDSEASSKRHDGLEVGLLSSDQANLTTTPNASIAGAYTGQGKTRFFSELPEEHKVIVIITHIGRETMNDFEKRVREEAAAKTAKKTTKLTASGGAVKMQGN